MIATYDVLLDDDTLGILHLNCTEEGLIVDLYNVDGSKLLSTWARTAQEFTEELINA